ncbi:Glucuronosyltransferase [Aphelenchoides besseyi]|nr:Glucuronosyltransferase [Aphelenchoides besseyi]
MPDNLLDEFLHAFASIPLRFVWQTNSEPQVLRDRRRIPDNVVLARWIPIKNVLAHRNLQFVVTHGGVNTINELLIFGVPILGVPLQGDQTSNLQRLSELGAASATLMYDLHTPGTFLKQLQDLQRRLPTIKQRAKKLSEMIASYRQLNGKAQNFWLHWAKRHGPTIQSVNGYGRERKFFELKLRSGIDYLALRELAIWSFVISSTICLLTR